MKQKKYKDIRDPIHDFIRITSDEQKIVDHPRFQRLRDISQLSFTHLVYPGATHKRFEHSLGVMYIASKIFDTITDDQSLDPDIKDKFKKQIESKDYWRQVLRIAALCHDIGHLPFSHTLEELLGDSTTIKRHEDLSRRIIEEDLAEIISGIKIGKKSIKTSDVAFITAGTLDTGNSNDKKSLLDNWKDFLRQIITSDFFGADRTDYLLRDAYHAGVPYGLVDSHRLLSSIKLVDVKKIIIGPDNIDKQEELNIVVKEGDVPIVTSFLMSRQLMYSQVYQHPVCKAYDLHLEEFAKFLIDNKDAKYRINSVENLVNYSESYLLNILHQMKLDDYKDGSVYVDRLLERKHFNLVWRGNYNDAADLYRNIKNIKDQGAIVKTFEKKDNIDYIEKIKNHLQKKYGNDKIGQKNDFSSKPKEKRFFIENEDVLIYSDDYNGNYKTILDSLLTDHFSYGYIFADRDISGKVKKFLNSQAISNKVK